MIKILFLAVFNALFVLAVVVLALSPAAIAIWAIGFQFGENIGAIFAVPIALAWLAGIAALLRLEP